MRYALMAGDRPCLGELRRREELRIAIAGLRACCPRRLKRLSEGARSLSLEAAAQLTGGGKAIPTSVAEAMARGLAPQTWNHYLGPLRRLAEFARGRDAPWLPAEPILFAEFLVERSGADVGYGWTKSVCCAVAAVSKLAGVPPTGEHPVVAAARAQAQGCYTPHLRP